MQSTIRTKPSTEAYRNNWDIIFKEPKDRSRMTIEGELPLVPKEVLDYYKFDLPKPRVGEV